MVHDEQANAQTRGERLVEKLSSDVLVLNVLPAFFESGSQLRHDVLVVVQEIPQQAAVRCLLLIVVNRRESAQYVKRSNIQFMLQTKYKRKTYSPFMDT